MSLKPNFSPSGIEAGVDEAGRGCYAGPVVAAAVIFRRGYYHPLLNDSKQLKESQRNLLRDVIEKEALGYGVGFVDNLEIDKVNILQATYQAMHKAINQLKITPDKLLIDGNRFKSYEKIPHHCIIKGDTHFISIAAASILAKTYRDAYMQDLHKEFPCYGWNVNKGYGTAKHRRAIELYGLCSYHRKSFRINPIILNQ
ncbi:MAG: ribonuclease HII [Ferruginibacter sp.]|nr:ribonuclease HII [Ferruginibacter sp.]